MIVTTSAWATLLVYGSVSFRKYPIGFALESPGWDFTEKPILAGHHSGTSLLEAAKKETIFFQA
jgi:hypothetical protein